MSLHWVVQKIVERGRHGPYAVADDERLGSVTFALTPDVWKDKRLPELGSEVVLEDFQKKHIRNKPDGKKRDGWRAMYARFVRPEDVNSNQ